MRAIPLRFAAAFVRLVLVAWLAIPAPAAAQMLEQPLTVLHGPIDTSQLAAGRDGAILQVGSPDTVVRLFPTGDTTFNGGVVLSGAGADRSGAVTALRHGGFAVAFPAFSDAIGQYRTSVQRFSPAGMAVGPTIGVTPYENASNAPGIAPHGDGFVLAVASNGDIVGQRFDATGTPIGGIFPVSVAIGIANTRVVALPGGRFLVVWGRDGATRGRVFEADATPVGGGDFIIATSVEQTGLAVNAAGTLAALVGSAHDDDPTSTEARLRFFTPAGSWVGPDQVLAPVGRPDVATDSSGNFLVMTSFSARAYDASGVALGPPVTLGPLSGAFNLHRSIRVVGRTEGGFFAMQNLGSETRVALITLCAPGSAVCGDGTLVSTCEICDDGAGNSDTTPDACRTDCRPSRCGDGTTDADEQCDDGNHKNCDGCTELCDLEVGTVCGDGIVAPQGCKEQCDDGDFEAGDGCSATCKGERIFGGGKSTTDCYAAWRIDNASNDPRFDKRGGVNPKQRCRDNDPACDFDGGVTGSCTFHLALCVNNSEPSGCTEDRLASWTVLSPSEKQALTRPALAAVRAALLGAVVPNVVGAGDPDTCSPDAEVVLPLRGGPGGYKASKLTLKTAAAIYSGDVDRDNLQLRCDP
jgi:cysteine-rich repeat protein